MKLSNGISIPEIGFGTWQTPDGKTAADCVKYALSVGYRHIDTAACYGNEKGVGEGIKAAIDEGIVKREDVFLTSKLWNTERGYDKTLRAFEQTIRTELWSRKSEKSRQWLKKCDVFHMVHYCCSDRVFSNCGKFYDRMVC